MLEIGGYTLAGNKYHDLNQDFLIKRHVFSRGLPDKTPLAEAYHVVAVLDGHGIWGEKAAELAGEAITEAVQEELSDLRMELDQLSKDQMLHVIQVAVEQGHKAAMTVYDDPPTTISLPLGKRRGKKYNLHADEIFGHVYVRPDDVVPFECGTTCVVAIVQGNRYLVGYVGDSGAVLTSEDNAGFSGRTLTPPHSFDCPQEISRVRSAVGDSAVVIKCQGPPYLRVLSGPGAGQEVLMSRALGHKSLANYGITPIPDIAFGEFSRENRGLILASDGVWDWVDPKAAAELVLGMAGDGSSAQAAAEELVHLSVETALDDLDCLADNATAMVVLFSDVTESEASDLLTSQR